ncbi:SufE family protein [Hyphobacterium sp. HN65]|uniref:SufE family protein n=1 Tax=Hyphobacterium lacteum TaxID=3116575 RepID=A0ABU7LUL8_9PROT|nr:SufE family protein [Hyphobacterium sp. HN65]MEE2527039.1 SufE family protein [Hyphobacterium sp. HN65]
MTPDVKADIDELVEEFDFLGDWEERYRYLIDLGQAMPALSDDEKSEDNRVKGCTSRVWLVIDDAAGDAFRFRADSDAHIVKGLAALLIRLYSGRGKDDIAAIDPREVLTRIGLAEHLSPQRSNGLNSMIARIRKEAGVST